MSETAEHRLKRLKMRSMRRGIKEMDLILTSFASGKLAGMEPAMLDCYEALLDENDQDLYQWVTGQVATPAQYDAMIADIAQTFQK